MFTMEWSTVLQTIVGASVIPLLYRIYTFCRTFYRRRTIFKGYPMPPYSFFWGHLKVFGEMVAELPPDIHPHTLPYYLHKKYNLPDVFYLDTWPIGQQICAIVEPEVAQQPTVLTSLPKHETLDASIWPITGYGSLAAMHGQEHKRWRSIFNPGFSSSHLMSLIPAIVGDCELFAGILEKHIETQDIFHLEEAATKVTIDIIGRVVLDVSMNAQTTDNEFVTAFRSQLDWLYPLSSVNLLQILNPVRPIMFKLNEWKMNRYLMDVMNKRFVDRGDQVTTTKRSKPIIDLAMDVYKEEGSQQDIKTLNATFKKEALKHIKIFMFAGHDTTSSTICWVGYVLTKYPEISHRFRQECDEVFGPDPSGAAQKIKEDPRILNRLPYATAIIKEVLRLWPAASSVRKGLPDFFINYDGRQYPTEGTITWPVVHAIQRNPRFWPQPNAFLPDRWLAQEGDPLFPTKGAWRAFEHGPRNCIGQELAMLETKIVMALLFRTMKVETAYEEFDAMQEKAGKGRKGGVKTTPEGERAYQVLIATAKPCDGMPARMQWL